MKAPRPKILTAVTVPTGGWTMKVQITDAVSFDTDVTFDVPAGTYFVAGDNQSDDFLQAFMAAAYTALDACGVGAYNQSNIKGKPILHINSDHKVVIEIGDGEEMSFDWDDSSEAESIGKVLGFDVSANANSEGNPITADYPHAYGWYATEDGQLEEYMTEDITEANVLQSVAPSGWIKTTHLANVYMNRLALQYLTEAQTFSDGVAYTEASVDPYTRNQALECWFREAVQGVHFRVYEQARMEDGAQEVRGTATAGTNTTQLEDTTQSYTTDPQEHAGKVLSMYQWTAEGNPMRWYISSHDGDTLTVPNAVHNTDIDATDSNFRIYPTRYRTYVLDTNKLRRFEPSEYPRINRYAFRIPLRRYVG